MKKLSQFLISLLFYYLFSRYGLLFALGKTSASPFWPATGLGILLLIYNKNLFPAIFLGALFANLHSNNTWTTMLFIATGSLVEAFLGYLIYTWIEKKQNSLLQMTQTVSVAATGILAPLPSVLLGLIGLYVGQKIDLNQLATTAITWWIGNATGALLTISLFLEFKNFALNLNKENSFVHFFKTKKLNLKKTLVSLFVFILSSYVVFFTAHSTSLLFLIYPCLLLYVVYMNERWMLVALLSYLSIGVWASWLQIGPFSKDIIIKTIFDFQLFITGAALSSLVLIYLKKIGHIKKPSVALFIGWAFSGLIYYTIVSSQQKEETQAFLTEIEKNETSIKNNLDAYIKLLDGGAALFAASKSVERSEWSEFSKNIHLEEKYPGIDGFGFLQHVRTEDLQLFLQEAQKDDAPDFQIKKVIGVGTPENEKTDSHYIVKFIEPKSISSNVIGLDLSTEKTRRFSVEKVKEAATPTLSEPMEIIYDQKKRIGFLLFKPIYKKNVDLSDVEIRKKSFLGTVYLPFISEKFFSHSMNTTLPLSQVEIYSNSTVYGELLIYSNVHSSNQNSVVIEKHLTLAGHHFILKWRKAPGRLNDFYYSTGAFFALISALITIILALLISNLETVFEKANQIAQQKTKELEALHLSMIQTAKLSSLGEMAAGIAHEINNPLTIIQGKASRIQKFSASSKETDSSTINTDAEKIILTVQRIAKIVKGLKSLSRDAGQDPYSPTSISDIAENALEMIRERFKNLGIEIKTQIESHLQIECRESQIIQVLINLLNNSYDAIENLDEKWVSLEIRKEKDCVLFRITDSGPGIPAEIANKMMDPFFTTKEIGKGTGLGLSISRAIINNHKGKLEIDHKSKNTCFLIYLPIHH